MQKVHNQVKPLLLNKAKHFLPKKQINILFTVNVALSVVWTVCQQLKGV